MFSRRFLIALIICGVFFAGFAVMRLRRNGPGDMLGPDPVLGLVEQPSADELDRQNRERKIRLLWLCSCIGLWAALGGGLATYRVWTRSQVPAITREREVLYDCLREIEDRPSGVFVKLRSLPWGQRLWLFIERSEKGLHREAVRRAEIALAGRTIMTSEYHAHVANEFKELAGDVVSRRLRFVNRALEIYPQRWWLPFPPFVSEDINELMVVFYVGLFCNMILIIGFAIAT